MCHAREVEGVTLLNCIRRIPDMKSDLCILPILYAFQEQLAATRRGPLGVQCLAQGHFKKQAGVEPLTVWLKDDPSLLPELQPPRYYATVLISVYLLSYSCNL